MRADRERQVEAERPAVKEEAAQMEAERRVVAMKADIQAASVELSCHISDCFQIQFRLVV